MNGTPSLCANTEQTVTLLEWCAGYGGIGLGLRRAIPNLRTIGYAEIEDYPITILASLMEKGLIDIAPIWSNLKAWPCEEFRGKVDILVAGFPCQPFSHAGKRGGDEDPRHLWPYISRAIGIIRPRYVFCENVEGILSARLAGDQWSDPEGTPVLLHVLRELERLGYRATAGLFSAAEQGAPHNRKRTFICGMDDSQMHRCKCGIFDPSNIGCTDIPVAGTDIPWPTGPSENQQLWEPPRAIFVSKRGAASDDDGDDDGLADADSGGLEGAEQGGGEGGCPDALCEGGEPMVNSACRSNGLDQAEQQGRDTLGGSGAEGSELGDPTFVHGHGGINNSGVGEQPGQVPHLGDAGGQGNMAHPGLLGQARAELQATGPEQLGEGSGSEDLADPRCNNAGCAVEPERASGNLAGQGCQGNVGDTTSPGQPSREHGQGQGQAGGADSRPCDNLRDGEAIEPLGGDTHGATPGLGGYRLPGLSDYQLAEICEWLSKTPHRAEELKMLGNGVIPCVSEKAWRTLVKRLWDGKVGV